MSRKPSNIPKLRQGCFPREGWPNPPHDHREDGEPLRVLMVEVDADRDGRVPYFWDVSAGDEGIDYVVYRRTLIEVITPNGWRCYVDSMQEVSWLLHLAQEGPGAIQAWMEGRSWEEAAEAARANREAREQRMKAAREEAAKQSGPKLDLDIGEIDI